MKVFTCNNFIGKWPVGTAAVILASNSTKAKKILFDKLEEIGLGEKNQVQDFTIEEINQRKSSVTILCNGDY